MVVGEGIYGFLFCLFLWSGGVGDGWI